MTAVAKWLQDAEQAKQRLQYPGQHSPFEGPWEIKPVDSAIKIVCIRAKGPNVNGTQMYGGFHVTPEQKEVPDHLVLLLFASKHRVVNHFTY